MRHPPLTAADLVDVPEGDRAERLRLANELRAAHEMNTYLMVQHARLTAAAADALDLLEAARDDDPDMAAVIGRVVARLTAALGR